MLVRGLKLLYDEDLERRGDLLGGCVEVAQETREPRVTIG